MSATDFIYRANILVQKLKHQGFESNRLKRVFEKFAVENYELLFKHDQSIKHNHSFDLTHICFFWFV